MVGVYIPNRCCDTRSLVIVYSDVLLLVGLPGLKLLTTYFGALCIFEFAGPASAAFTPLQGESLRCLNSKGFV